MKRIFWFVKVLVIVITMLTVGWFAARMFAMSGEADVAPNTFVKSAVPDQARGVITYTFSVNNETSQNVHVVITDHLPLNTTFLSGYGWFTVSNETNSVVMTRTLNLEPGLSSMLNMVVKVDEAFSGLIINTADASMDFAAPLTSTVVTEWVLSTPTPTPTSALSQTPTPTPTETPTSIPSQTPTPISTSTPSRTPTPTPTTYFAHLPLALNSWPCDLIRPDCLEASGTFTNNNSFNSAYPLRMLGSYYANANPALDRLDFYSITLLANTRYSFTMDFMNLEGVGNPLRADLDIYLYNQPNGALWLARSIQPDNTNESFSYIPNHTETFWVLVVAYSTTPADQDVRYKLSITSP